jgi:hypothetical protein
MFETLDDAEQDKEALLGASEELDNEKALTSFEGPPTLAFILAAVLLFASLFLGHQGSMRAFTATCYLSVGVFATGLFWGLRNRAWFWITMTVLLLLHLPLVLYAPLSGYWLHGKNGVLIDFADFAVYFLVLAAMKKLTLGRRKGDGTL